MTTPPSANVLEETLERTAKYTKKWVKRFVRFDPSERRLSYGETSAKIKATMAVSRITRHAETAELPAGHADLWSFIVEGASADGKTSQWWLRCPSEMSLQTWHTSIRGTLARLGLMESLDYGLPPVDPRFGLAFAPIPLECLCYFQLLEKAIVFFFAALTPYLGAGVEADKIFIGVGERHVYLFRANGNIVRCFKVEEIAHVWVTKDATAMAINVPEPEFDVVLTSNPGTPPQNHTPGIPELHAVLLTLFARRSLNIPIDVFDDETLKGGGDATPAAAAAALVDAKGLVLNPPPTFRLTVASPTSKAKLRAALDDHEARTGTAVGGGAAVARRANSDVPPAPPTLDPADAESALGKWLHGMGLSQYTLMLRKQHVDVDVLSCMDDADLAAFGVKNAAHRATLLQAVKGGGGGGFGGVPAPTVVLETPAKVPLPRGTEATGATGGAMSASMGAIVLSDDDDDLILPTAQKAAPTMGEGVRPAMIALSDSDDDLLPSPARAPPPAPRATISLSDDDI